MSYSISPVLSVSAQMCLDSFSDADAFLGLGKRLECDLCEGGGRNNGRFRNPTEALRHLEQVHSVAKNKLDDSVKMLVRKGRRNLMSDQLGTQSLTKRSS
jgi:hypothetical protein